MTQETKVVLANKMIQYWQAKNWNDVLQQAWKNGVHVECAFHRSQTGHWECLQSKKEH